MKPAEEDALVMVALKGIGADIKEMDDVLKDLIRAAVANERERAARVCEEQSKNCLNCQKGDANELSNVMLRHHAAQAMECAAAIRRGE